VSTAAGRQKAGCKDKKEGTAASSWNCRASESRQRLWAVAAARPSAAVPPGCNSFDRDPSITRKEEKPRSPAQIQRESPRSAGETVYRL
jgi:hypothetical protein